MKSLNGAKRNQKDPTASSCRCPLHDPHPIKHGLEVKVFQALTSHPHSSHGLLEPLDEFVVLDDAILVLVCLQAQASVSLSKGDGWLEICCFFTY